jgi:hypothetical protein
MRTKLFGAFIAALAIAAFAALPAAAMAEPVVYRQEEEVVTPSSLKATSKNLTFSAGGLVIECATSTVGGAVRGSTIDITAGTFLNAGGTEPCKTNNPSIDFTVPAVAGSITFERDETEVRGSGEVRFQLRFRIPGFAMVTCDYNGEFETRTALNSDVIEITKGAVTLESGGERESDPNHILGCPSQATVAGQLRLTRRDGTPVQLD